MAEFLEEDLEDKFSSAADFLPSLISKLSSESLLKFYAYYKQATVGPCNTPSPYWYDFQNKSKWTAWKSLGQMSQNEAMSNYISLLNEIEPNWENNDEFGHGKKQSWVAVSTMLQNSEIDENDKDIFDWVREGNLEKVKNSLQLKNIDEFDENGMTALHWAADRGLSAMVSFLLECGASIDKLDGMGQTALHYAACCGHLEVAKILIEKGAQIDVKCSEGFAPKDLANDELIELFK